MKEKIANILKEHTKKNGISASFVILEDYAEELVKHGVQPVIQCEKCKYWKKYGNDPIIERCWGECCRPLGEDGGLKETAENDFCSYAEEAIAHPTEKGGDEE
jgi:hypothetical protein